MSDAERLAERTPERIWLIDMGDCISWCDDPDPAGTGEDDAVEYVRAQLIRAQSARIAALEEALRAIEDMETDWALGIDGGMENARRAARKALGKRSE